VSLAFQALAIFALALPGIILKNTYRNGFFWDRPRQTSPLTEEVAYSLVLACAVHGIFAPLVDRWFWPVDFKAIAILLLGQYGKDSQFLAPVVNAMTSHPGRIIAYFISVYVISAALGYGAHAIVRGLRLDCKVRFLRFDHQWHYLLHGEIAKFPESNIFVPEKIDLISLACVVDTHAGSFLYVGVLDAFYFNKAGELDLIVVTGAMRRPIDSKEDSYAGKPDYFFIDAEYLYLKYSEIRNVSIRYIVLPEDAEEAA
jgi:hypothetical protein